MESEPQGWFIRWWRGLFAPNPSIELMNLDTATKRLESAAIKIEAAAAKLEDPWGAMSRHMKEPRPRKKRKAPKK
jgi:hypothetical protein